MSNAKISKFVGQWVKKILSFKIYKCTHCNDETNNKFTKKSLLEKHIKKFHLEFFCNYCASCGFTTKSHLEEHMKIFHNFKCNFCDNASIFTTKHALKKHMNDNHTLKCEFCNTIDIFTKNALEAHMKLCQHFTCTYCDNNQDFAAKPIFRTAIGLEKHISVIHKCDNCKTEDIFESMKDKMEHIKLHHKNLTVFVAKCP